MAREDGPFEYFDERTGSAGVTAASIRANLTDPDKNNASIVAMATTLDQDGQRAASQVEGDIDTAVRNLPDGARATATNLGANGAYALGLMRSFADNVETFDNKVSDCNWQYRTQLASALRWAGRAAAETDDPEDDKTVDAAHLGPGIESYIRQNDYNPAWNTLDGQIEALVADFGKGPSNERVRELIRQGLLPLAAASLYPGLTLSEADKTSYYEHVLSSMSVEEQKQWIEANLDDLDPAIAHVVDPTVMEYFADEVAADIQDPENIDERTVALMGFLANEEPFATQLYETVTPDQMADAISHLNYDLFGVGDTTESRSYGLQGDGKAQLELYDKFMNSAGLALATYSRSPGVDQGELAETWFRAITDDDNPENAAALTLLIREGGEQKNGVFGTEFLDQLTQKVYDWERDQDGAVWGPRAGQDGIWIRDPDKVSINQYENEYGELEYFVEGRGEATDGLANLLGGMGHSPDAALRFFTDSDGHVDNGKMDYFIGGGDGRTWDVDDRSDDGDGLGEALEAAIVGHDERTPGGTEIANKLFENIAEHGGEANEWNDNKWHVGPEMTDSLGAITSGYTEDVYDMLSNTPPRSGDTHLNVNPDVLADVLREIGRTDDKTGLETLTTAMLVETRDRNFDFLNGVDGPRNMSDLANIGYAGLQNTNGNVLGNLLNFGLDLAEDEDKTDAARAAMIAKGISILGGFVPGAGDVLGEGAGHLAESTYDAIKGEGLSAIQDAVRNSPGSDNSAYREGAEDELPSLLYYNAISDLYRADFLGPQTTQRGDFPGVSDDLFVGKPPTLNPALYDADGYELDPSQYSAADIERIRSDYRDLVGPDSTIASLLEQNSYSGNFYDRMQNPTKGMDGA